MIRSFFCYLSFAALLLLPSHAISLQAVAADQVPGDEHWAGELSVPGFNNNVTTLISDLHGHLYAGGDFTAYGGETVNHIAIWDGSTWSGLGNGLDERAHNLAVDSKGNLYTDVLIFSESGNPETVVMRWDGSSWSTLGGDLSGLVDTLEVGRESNILIMDIVVDSRDRLYASGHFYLSVLDKYVGYVARWDGSDWTLVGSGMNHTVYNLAVDGQDNLFASGEFTSAGGVPANRIAVWDGDSWNAMGSGIGGEAPTIADMVADESGNLFVTGQFDTAGGIPIQLIAMWDGASWKELAPGENAGWFEGEYATIFDLSISQQGDLYAGGSFTAIDGVEANNIAKWDGSTWSAVGTNTGNGVNGEVFAVTIDEKEQIFVGGHFSNAGGLPANYIAMWDGSSWFTWMEGSETGMNNIVSALAVDHNGDLYAGGYFTSAGEVPANHVARWDGKEWKTLADGVNAAVHTLALDNNGGLYAGGDFTAAGDIAANYIARWDGTTWSALGDGVGEEDYIPQVRALVVDHQGFLYAGGDFSTAGGIAVNNIARWDGSGWSALGRGMDDQVMALALDSAGFLYAAGAFTRAGDVEARGIARWDGSTWSALGNGSGLVKTIAVDQEGSLYAGGMIFISPDSNTFHYAARWDGSTWSLLGSGPGDFVQTLAVDNTGNLYAGGDFTEAGELPARRIALWDGANWRPLGSGIGAEGDYSSIAALAIDGRGNLYVGGQFTLAGNKPSSYLAKWCTELEAGSCTFFSKAIAITPEPTPILTVQAPTPSTAPRISATQSLPTPTISPADVPPDEVVQPGRDGLFWVGAGVILAFLLGGLVLLVSRRS